MPPISMPANLQPFVSLGMEFTWVSGSKDAIADLCPWCDAEGKFSVKVETGQWRCFKCNRSLKGDGNGSNIQGFIKLLWEDSFEATQSSDYRQLARDRKILNYEKLMQWELCKSTITGDWLVPGFNADGKLATLYTYTFNYKDQRYMLMPTKTLGHRLFGRNVFNTDAELVYICEGIWDGISLYENLSIIKQTDDESYDLTSNVNESLLSNASVLATPAAEVFNDDWISLLSGKTVVMCTQSDHPKERKGKVIPPASATAIEKISKRMLAHKKPPTQVLWLEWGKDGYNPDLKSGYDIRDILTEEITEEDLDMHFPLPKDSES